MAVQCIWEISKYMYLFFFLLPGSLGADILVDFSYADDQVCSSG